VGRGTATDAERALVMHEFDRIAVLTGDLAPIERAHVALEALSNESVSLNRQSIIPLHVVSEAIPQINIPPNLEPLRKEILDMVELNSHRIRGREVQGGYMNYQDFTEIGTIRSKLDLLVMLSGG
jgi:hypothetical protein